MKYLKNIVVWISESTARTFTGLLVLSIIVSAGTYYVKAASWDVTNEVQMNLDVSINSTQTTGIVIAAPQLNGANHTFATLTGGILRIRYGSYREDIYYTSATVNATTKKVTLVGVTRNVCSQHGRTIITCGDGRNWGKGAIVELTVDSRLLNWKANIDRANVMTASGALSFSGSGSLAFPTFATTAARDQALGATPVGPVRAACVTATSTCYLYYGGAWTAIGNTGVSAATETTLGTVELATLKDQSGSLTTGSVGPLVLQARYTTGTGGTTRYGYIPYIGRLGTLTGGMLGTNYDTAKSNSGNFLSVDGTYKNPTSHYTLACMSGTGSTYIGQTTTNETNYSVTCTIPVAYISTGAMIHIYGAGDVNDAAGDFTFYLKARNQRLSTFNAYNTFPNDTWVIDGKLFIRSHGKFGKIMTTSNAAFRNDDPAGTDVSNFSSSTYLTVDTAASTGMLLQFAIQPTSSNGGNQSRLLNLYAEVIK